MEKEEDIKMLELIRKNPQSGITTVIDRYAGIVYTIIHNQLSTFAKEDIEECVNDTFYDFYSQIDRIDLSIGTIKSLLCIIAKRKAINFYNTRNAIRRTSDSTSLPYDEIDISGTSTPEDDYIECESRFELISKIKNLGKPDSEIIIRKYYFLQSSKQIAKDLDLTVNAVDLRVFRALKRLRNNINGGIVNE